MRRKIVLFIGALATALAVLPAPHASAGSSTVFIGGTTFGFSLCAEFGDEPNNWVLTVTLSPSSFVQYGSSDADKSSFKASRNEGEIVDKTGLAVTSNSNPILGKLEATYRDGRNGTVTFAETSPIKVKYQLSGPAVVDTSANYSATF